MAKKTFEESLTDLEKTVRQLESGDLTLDESVTAFESGMKMVKECETKLQEAKGKIEKLVSDASGQTVTEPFLNKE